MTKERYTAADIALIILLGIVLLIASYSSTGAQSMPGGCYVGHDGEVWCVQVEVFLPIGARS